MAKFDKQSRTVTAVRKTPIRVTSTVPTTTTFEGGLAFGRDPKSELFMLAISNMAGEQTFYEDAKSRDSRFVNLIHQVTKDDPAWVAGFIPYLRETMFMRSASTVMACEYVRAGGPNGAAVVDSALKRPDEPAELLAYWGNTYAQRTAAGSLPAAIRKGVAKAVNRMYNERAALKYDGLSRGWRMADVLNAIHAKPKDTAQEALFKFLIDRRFDRPLSVQEETLPMIAAWLYLSEKPVEERRAYLLRNPEMLPQAGLTWEALSGMGKMDKEAWEAVIPSMGYMALLRNLRNFDQAGVSDEVATAVAARLSDPAEVAKSMQFPFRFLSAYLNTESNRWALALDKALDLSTQNIPALGGRTLILTDTSGSMQQTVSQRSKMSCAEVGALFSAALAKKGEDVTLVEFASNWAEYPIDKSASVLRHLDAVKHRSGRHGYGTETFPALLATYKGHDRVVIITDGQAFPYNRAAVNAIKAPIYGFNVAGYSPTPFSAKDGQFEFGGGMSDATFRMLEQLETVGHTGWPWE